MGRPTHYNNNYRLALKRQIKALPDEVFRRQDLTKDYSSNAQLRLTRALNAFIKDGLILKISHGVYAKANLLKLFDNRPVLRKSFEEIAIDVLNKLGVNWEYGSAIQEYNQGKTQQIPVRFTIKLKSRLRRNIIFHNRKVYFEGNINAR
ncbi:MAG: hypothetical protein K0U12_06015 [Gammaproteobacteria bacterium]|nr:hypothetical protein [Gammaproteobacteria bacterium]